MERKNKSPIAVAPSLPQLDFQNPFAKASNEATTFLPLHREKKYAYPLLIWLGGSVDSNFELSRVMPKISLRNYIGVAPKVFPQGDIQSMLGCIEGSDEANRDERVFECIDKASLQYNINTNRMFIAGCGLGGALAIRLAFTYSDYFAGAISLGGQVQSIPGLFGNLRANRKTPIFLTQCRDDESYTENELCSDLRALHVGGFSVTARQYPGTQPVNDQMLHDVDLWMMEIINGYDMTRSGEATHEIN